MQTMKKLFLILSVAAGLVSCEDFLTAGDPNKIDAPSYFRNESDLEAYANGFLQTMIPTAISVATGDARADYMAWRGEWQYLTDNFDADDQSGWSRAAGRTCATSTTSSATSAGLRPARRFSTITKASHAFGAPIST